MSGKAGGLASIVVGAVLGVVAIASGNPYLGFAAVSMIAGGTFALTNKPKVADGSAANNQELRLSGASLGNPVIVLWGRGLCTPNYIRVETTTYNKEPYYGEVQAQGKGGKKKSQQQLAGYKHFLQYELGICMGPVDAIGQIISVPGEIPMIDAEDPWTYFSGSLPEDIELKPEGTEGDFQGGIARFYSGALDQVRDTTGDPYALPGVPYRGVCWALFGAGEPFCIGTTAYAKTYRVWVERMPKCIRDNGTTVTQIITRGSEDTEHPAYNAANPVAIVYEAYTNKLWGRRLSSDIFDEDEWGAVSEFYAAKGIGLSIVMEETDKLEDFVNMIFQHCRLLVYHSGGKYRCKSLLDIETTHGTIETLTDADITNFEVDVPSWPTGSINEIRAEYTNHSRGARGDIVHAQSDAAIDILGGRLVPERVQLIGFTDYNSTFGQAARILSEKCYPFRVAAWQMNHYKSQIEIGSVVRVIWKEATEVATTTYWMIIDIDYGDPDSDEITVTGVEDSILPPVEGIELEVTLPTKYPWERITAVPEEEVNQAEPPITPEDIPAIEADETLVLEIPAIATGGTVPRVVIGVENYPALNGIYCTWSLDNVKFFPFDSFAGQGGTLLISLTLDDAIPGNQYIDRSEAGFRFTMNRTIPLAIVAYNESILLRCSLIDEPTDNIEDLLLTNNFYLVAGEEIMQVGKIEHVAGNQYRMRNIIRGRFGTEIRSYPAGTIVFYSEKQLSGINTANLPQNKEMYFSTKYVSYRGAPITSTIVQPYHEAPNDDIYLGVGIRPLHPSPVHLVDNGATVTLRARPRFFDSGAGVTDFETAMNNPTVDLQGMTFSYQQVNSSGNLIDPQPVPVSHTFTPGDLATPGFVEVEITKGTNARQFRLFAALSGQTSVRWAEFSI